MELAMRRTGIDVIGHVPWGTHFCQFYETGQDLIDILVPYFKEGLDTGEFCMWVTSEPLRVDQATAALKAAVPDLDDYINKGQIEILDYRQWYTRSGKFSADEVLKGWVDKLTEAQKRGFEGLRLTGNTFWLEKADWNDFTRYEETVNNVIGRYKMLAICTYSLQKCNALEILDVVANHQFALIKRSGRWEIIESDQHKKTEQALRESEEKLSALYASMVEGVALHEIVYDSAGNPADYIITDVNPSFEKITGLSRDSVLGKRASALYGTDEPPYLDVYAAVASSSKPESFETYFEPMEKHFSISVFSPSQGKFAIIFSDITNRKQMEEALQEKQEELEVQAEELEVQNEELRTGNEELAEAIRKLQESESRNKSLAENVPSVLMRYDRDFRVVYLSPQAEKITGIPTEQFIGKTNRDVGMPEDLCDMWEAAIQRVFQTGTNQDLEFEFPAADGVRTFYLKFAPEFASDSTTIQHVLGISTEISERKRMEEELAKLASFPKLNPNPITEVDLAGKVHFLNAVAEQLFPDLQDMGCNHPWLADWDSVVQAFRKNETGSYTHDVLVGERWYQQSIYFVPGTQRIRIYGMDITESKKAEETRSLLASIVDSAEEAVIGKTLEGIIVSWNAGAEKIYGYFADEVISRPISILIPTGHVDEMPQILEKIRRGERVDRYETTRLRKDGKQIYVSLTVSPITNERGAVIGASTIASDITERRLVEAALQEAHEELEVSAEELRQQNEELLRIQSALLESETRLRRFYESGLIGVIYWNMDGVITDANDKFLEMVGYSREDLEAGRIDWINMTPPEYRHLDESSAIELKATGVNKKPFEKEYICKDGTRIPIIIAGAMLDEARFNGVAFVLDITERKQAEEALKEAKDYLEVRVKERTSELSSAKEELEIINEELQVELEQHRKLEAELVKAKEAAEAAVEAKAAFLANMSHELRTPMNAVIGVTGILLEENLPPEQKEYLEIIRNGGEAMMTLISDLLDFTRVEKEKVSLEYQPFSLRACVEESLGQVSAHADKKSLDLAYTIKYGVPDAFIGDPGRLRQVLVNLLSNAVKFTDEGEVSISISSKAIGEKKHQLHFAVKDTGIGIPQEKMDQLFQPFSQVETTISRKRDGAGLGLAICKGLVELMGGSIWAKSELGTGSTFYFTIEAEVARDLPATSEVPDESIENLSEQYPLRILVAEDNPSNQRVLVEILKRMGYRADAVADGREVIVALERRPYDLILMDIRMPEMDGLKATQEIRRRWSTDGPRIIAITAYALAGDREMCLEAGMNDYIAKPVQKGELAEILKRYALKAQ